MELLKIRKELRERADEKYRVFQSALIPGVENFLGVRRPGLRKMASAILKEDGMAFAECAGRDSFEEIMLKGLVTAGLPLPADELIPLVRAYVPEITDWCLCDTFCNELKAAKADREKYWDFIQPYLRSDKEFEARFGAVMILEHYICDPWIDRALEALFQVKQPDYYAQMAVAWAYSMCYVKYPEKTESYLAEHRLSEFTYKKTISKIRDSLPVPGEVKDRLKKFGFQNSDGIKEQKE